MERLDLDQNSVYSSLEGSIHVARYAIAKNICKNKKVLDVACGEGYGSYMLKSWGAEKVLGIDISKETIKKAKNIFGKNINNLKYEEANACHLDKIENNIFDMIVSFETFEHVENIDLFLEEIKRVSTDDATIIISCPNDYMYYPIEKESNPFHKKKYKFEEFKKVCEKHLGKADKYMAGFPCRGYINCIPSNQNKGNQLEMLKAKELNNSFAIPSDSETKMENSSYYIGVWGTNEELCNSVQYPISMIDLPKDFYVKEKEITYLKDTIEHQKEIIQKKEKEISKIQTDFENKEEKYKKELENQKIANESINKELNFTRDNSYKLYEKLKAKEEEIYWINKSRAYKISKKIAKVIKR